MSVLPGIIGIVCGVLGLVCWFIVLVDAFRDSILKGLACVLCGIYWLYYAITEFEHENKWLIIAGTFLGGIARAVTVVIMQGARAH